MSAFAQVAVTSASSARRDPLDVQTMTRLALSRHKDVRRTLAARDDVPLAIQAILASDSWFTVRATVAHNPTAARSVLALLASDAHRGVVEALLENPSTPPEALESLASHALPTVRMKAARLLLRHPRPGLDAANHPDAKIPELMERAPALGELDASEDVSARDDAMARRQGGLSELDAAIAAAALFAELTCPVPKARRPH